MKAYEQWYSNRLEQDISLVRWGHYGRPVLVFPTAGGDSEEIERHHLVDHCQHLIDSGRIKLYSCDSIAGKAMVSKLGTPAYRMRLLNHYQDVIGSEVVPAIVNDCGGEAQSVIVSGSSIGAFNSIAILCRFPELFGAAIAMSGSYHLQRFYDNQFTEDLYFSSPLHFLPGLEGPHLDLLRERFVIVATGSGAWESPDESWEMGDALGAKGIPNRVDIWGEEWIHDWPTWWKMLPTYLEELCP
ncbi:MAG: esterase family protein [Actinomycetes bacterium]